MTHQTFTRRTVLRTGGLLVASGLAGLTAGQQTETQPADLRLVSEVAVPGSREVVTEDNYAYVATGDGMAIVDVRNPQEPEVVARVDLAADVTENLDIEEPGIVVLDVKVDGDVAAVANDGGDENPGGISLYDVSEPSAPEFLAQYQPTFEDDPGPSPGANIHNCFVAGDYAYLTLGEPWYVDEDGDGLGEKFWLFGNSGVDIADISDPSAPEQAGRWLLRDESPAVAKASRVPCHDLYVQDDVCYAALWDAGTAALDVSDPSDPSLISRFGSTVDADDAISPYAFDQPFTEYYLDEFGYVDYLTLPGNDHYVQPSPDGDHVYVGAETFPRDVAIENPGPDDYGGITVWDTSDLADPSEVTRIEPPVIDDETAGKLFTSHNFDVTENRLHTSWYHGGVQLYDITDPSEPERVAGYDPEGYAFWTAVADRGVTVGGVYGEESDGEGGLTILSDDEGEDSQPAFDGSVPPMSPEVGLTSAADIQLD